MYHILIKRGKPIPAKLLKEKAAAAFDGSLDEDDRAALNALYKWSATGVFSGELLTEGAVARIPYESTYADIVRHDEEGEMGSALFTNVTLLLHDYPDLLQDLGIEIIETGATTPVSEYPAYEHLK